MVSRLSIYSTHREKGDGITSCANAKERQSSKDVEPTGRLGLLAFCVYRYTLSLQMNGCWVGTNAQRTDVKRKYL